MQEGVVDFDPEAIALFVRSRAPGTVRIGIETGPTTTWLWTELNRLGLPVICIDARHAKAVLKMQINKSDRNDAAGIARSRRYVLGRADYGLRRGPRPVRLARAENAFRGNRPDNTLRRVEPQRKCRRWPIPMRRLVIVAT